MIQADIPLFPLNTVLFPGGFKKLRLFEPRYTKMLSACLKQDKPFGICLIREGSETDASATTYEMGTLINVIDWNMGKDGVLNLVVQGSKRFRILEEQLNADQLLCASIETIEIEESRPVTSDHFKLVDTYKKLSGVIETAAEYDKQEHDATWLGFRLAELLPIRLSQKQYFLQLFDSYDRLDGLSELMDQMDPNAIA